MSNKDNEPGVVNIKGKDYQTVAKRVVDFRKECPIFEGWGIITTCTLYDNVQVKFRADIIDPMDKVVATGTAQEFWDADKIHSTSSVEIAETSAVGRALAFCGFTGEQIATADEMFSAMRAQDNNKQSSDGLKDELGGSPKYEPPTMPMPNPVSEAQETEAEILDALKRSAKDNADKLADTLGTDRYHEWHVRALKNLALVDGGKIDDATSVDGLASFVDAQKIKMKGGDE